VSSHIQGSSLKSCNTPQFKEQEVKAAMLTAGSDRERHSKIWLFPPARLWALPLEQQLEAARYRNNQSPPLSTPQPQPRPGMISCCTRKAFIRRDKAGQDVLYHTKNLGMRGRNAPQIRGKSGYSYICRFRGATLNVLVWMEGTIRLAAFSGSFGTLQFSEYGEVTSCDRCIFGSLNATFPFICRL
jgi:hypothetical protein